MTPPRSRSPRLWPADMPAEEVRGRLHRMKFYNRWAKEQGMPQHCTSPSFVEARLSEVGADKRLLKIVFP